jgi:phosphoserine phosphatase
MVGDGISDLESKPEVDLFVGFGGVIAREAVRKGAGAWLEDMSGWADLSLPKAAH